MTDIRDAEPHPPDDSPGFCCVAAGMHEGHDEDCSMSNEALRLLGSIRFFVDKYDDGEGRQAVEHETFRLCDKLEAEIKRMLLDPELPDIRA